MTMLDVTGVPCAVGDVATFIGRDGASLITVEDAAALGGALAVRIAHGTRPAPRAQLPRGAIVRRAAIVVLDGVGIGEAPDAAAYGDQGSDTLGNIARAVGGLDLPNLAAAGLGHIKPIAGVPAVDHPRGAWGSMTPRSHGKDSTTGHWEIAGLELARAFPTFAGGFPPEVIAEFEQPHRARCARKRRGERHRDPRSDSAQSTNAPASGSSTRRPTPFSRWRRMSGSCRSLSSIAPARPRGPCSPRRSMCRA